MMAADDWYVFCPGYSLRYTLGRTFAPERSIAVNGAIILIHQAKYFALLDLAALFDYNSRIDMKKLAQGKVLWCPEAFTHHIKPWPHDKNDRKAVTWDIFNAFEKESYPGIALKYAMPWGNGIEWRYCTTTAALALAVLKGARKITVYGNDMDGGEHYCTFLDAEKKKDSKWMARWQKERAVFKEIVFHAGKHGVVIDNVDLSHFKDIEAKMWWRGRNWFDYL